MVLSYTPASKYLLDKLDAIQYKALTICLSFFKGTDLSSLQFECNESALRCGRNISTLKYLVKITSIPNYSTSEIFNNKYKINTLKIKSSFNTILKDFLDMYNLNI